MIHSRCATCQSLSPMLLVTSYFLLSTISSHYGKLTFDFDRLTPFFDPTLLVSPFADSTFDLLLVDLASCYRGRNLSANTLVRDLEHATRNLIWIGETSKSKIVTMSWKNIYKSYSEGVWVLHL